MNNYTFSGRIVSSRTIEYEKNGAKSNGLSIKVSVLTGQRAKGEGEYPPSMLIDLTVWDKLATVLEPKAVKGNFVVATGQLAAPTIYTPKEGEPGVNMSLHYVSDISIIEQGENSGSDSKKEPKAEKKSKNKVEQAGADEDFDEIPF